MTPPAPASGSIEVPTSPIAALVYRPFSQSQRATQRSRAGSGNRKSPGLSPPTDAAKHITEVSCGQRE
jgi:hypothetical protein